MAYNEAEVKRLLATPVKDLTPAEVEIVGFLLRQEPAMTERLLDEITAEKAGSTAQQSPREG